MPELAGWEWLLGGGLLVWVLWRLRNFSTSSLSDDLQPDEGEQHDWWGLLLPIAAVVVFVFLLIAGVRG